MPTLENSGTTHHSDGGRWQADALPTPGLATLLATLARLGSAGGDHLQPRVRPRACDGKHLGQQVEDDSEWQDEPQ